MLHGTVSCFTSVLSSFLPSFWLDLLQVSRHSCVFELLASFPLGCFCVPPANPSSQQAASASKVAGMGVTRSEERGVALYLENFNSLKQFGSIP